MKLCAIKIPFGKSGHNYVVYIINSTHNYSAVANETLATQHDNTNNWMLETIVPLNPSKAKKSKMLKFPLINSSSLTVVSANKTPLPIHSISPSTGLLPMYKYNRIIRHIHMWPDLRKPGFHTHPISWFQQNITYCYNVLEDRNFDMSFFYLT